ncbi:hypothetical protein BD408DRAFT_439696 [Parasitella parasitica]|nr:hypothetical protein BD408DRAFT_439696 [Parasitella parasitica]
MRSFLKASFYLCTFILCLINATSASSSSRRPNLNNDIELTKQSIKRRAKSFDENLAAYFQPCPYKFNVASKYNNMKRPYPFSEKFFETRNTEMAVTAKCRETYLSEDLAKDIEKLMLHYDDISPAQKLIVDYRLKTGYYKPIFVSKKGWPHADLEELVLKASTVAYAVFILKGMSAFLYKHFFIDNIHIENER